MISEYASVVPRAIKEKLGETPSVLDWGADPFASADSTVAIQTALNDCRGRLFIAPGEYIITGPLFIPANVSMFGADASRCKLRVAGTDPASIWIRNVSNVTLENFTFDCSETVSGIRIGTTDTATEDMQGIRLRGLHIKNSGNMTDPATTFRHGIEVKKGITLVDTDYGISGVWISECVVEDSAGDGIFGGDNLSVASYDVDGPGRVSNVFVSRCRFARAGRQNISIEGIGDTRPTRVFISDMVLEDSSLGGIDIEDADQVCLNNIIFVRSGAYEGYARHIDIPVETEMRSGLVLHGVEKQLTCSGLVFDHCHFGISGYLHVKMSDSKFINSYIFNGTASTAGRWEFVNCEFSGSGTLPLMRLLAPTATFSACKFNYTGTETFMIWLQSDTTYFGEVIFDGGCVFEGSGNTLDAISLQAIRSVHLSGCVFKNFRRIITDTTSFGDLVVSMVGCNIRTAEQIAVFGFLNLQDLNFAHNWCDEVKGGFSFSTADRAIIADNVFLVNMATGDGLSHDFFFANPVVDLSITNNIFRMTGTATDTRALQIVSKNDDKTPMGPIITGNKFIGWQNGIWLKQYDSLYQFRGAMVVGNHFEDVTNPLENVLGAHPNTFIQRDNVIVDTGVVLNGTSQYITNDSAYRIAQADGTQFPPAMRMWADTDNHGYVDATSGSLRMQVGASTKITVDSAGRTSVNTATVGGQMHVYVGEPATPGLVVRGAAAQTAPIVLIQKEDGSTLFLIESNGDTKAFGSFAPNNSNSRLYAGTGDPNGAVTAEVGSIYLRTDVNGIVYVKHSGSGNTGWNAISSTANVSSVFGRAGAVVAQTGDYNFTQISGTATAGQLPNIQDLNGVLIAAQVPNLEDLNGTLDIANGGTGATDAAGALAAIGAAPAVHNHSGQNLEPDNVTLVNSGQLKIRKADGSAAPAAIRMYATGDNGFVDATAGTLALQVGAGTKVTIDGSGNVGVVGNATAPWHHAPNTGGFKVASAAASFAPAGVRVYSDGSNVAYFDATAGSLIAFQIGADTKATLDSSGNLVIDGALAMGSPLGVASGGTGSTSAAGARGVLGAAASGANADITSLSALSTAISVGQGGTGSTSAAGARGNLGAAASGSNSDITALTGLTTPLGVTEGGTSAGTAAQARTNLAAAQKGGTGAQVTCPLAKITPGGLNGQVVFNADGVMINITLPT